MWVTVKVNSSVIVGECVAWDGSQYSHASSLATPLGVVIEAPTLDDDTSEYYAPVQFAGIAWAKASRDIPNEGGELMVESGGVYVDNNANGAGIIAPLPKGQSTRVSNDLVMIHIR